MSRLVVNDSNTGKAKVELDKPARPSRIRRDPVHVKLDQQLVKDAWWDSREWEIKLALAGIAFFAIAIAALVIDIGEVLSR
jgi:hypothetical protein